MTTSRRRLLWVGLAVVLLVVVLRFAIRWADATGRLPPPGELVVAAVTVLLLAALGTGVILLVRRGQTRKNR
jgi:polyferredoxin